jgi:hypothetical protein
MENKEIANILTILRSMTDYHEQHDELEKYPVETLELLAVGIYEKHFKRRMDYIDYNILELILHVRVIMLNKNFIWTTENVDKFLKISEKFIEIFEKAYREAKSAIIGLEKRIQADDPFLKDYEVEIKLTPYLQDRNEEINDRFNFVLSEPHGQDSLIFYFSHCHYNGQINEIPVYIDRSKNWNFERFNEKFKNYYVSYAVHELLDTYMWSFYDILKIHTIWADVKIEHQHFIENVGD